MQVHALTAAPAAKAAAPAPPRAAEAAPADPLDTLTRTSPSQASAPPPDDPWPQLAAVGLLPAGSAAPGAVGAVLTDAMRKGLLAALQRLDAAGVKFERKRMVRLPFVMDKFVAVTPEQALERIAKAKGEFKRLRAQVPGETAPMDVKGLKDLRAIDALKGKGASLLPPKDAVRLEAVESLAAQGAKFSTSNYSYYEEHTLTPVQAFRRMEDGEAVYCQVAGGREYHSVGKPEELFALDYFHGSGEDRGLADPTRAKRIKDGAARGLSFAVQGQEATPRAAYLAGSQNLGVRRKDSEIQVPLKPEDLQDLDGFEARLKAFEKAFDQHVTPLMGRQEYYRNTATYALFPEDPLLPLDVRCAVFGELFKAVARHDDRNTTETTVNLYRQLRKGSDSAYAMARQVRLVLPWIRQSGTANAMEALQEAQGNLAARAYRPEARQEVEDLFFRLLQATGSTEAAFEGLDLVRMPVGSERYEERLGLFLSIAAREGESTMKDTAAHYRALLVNRDPKEGLVRAGERFLRLLEGLAVGRHHARAPQVFAAIQADLVDGKLDGAGADDRVEQFLRNLALSNDVDRALEATVGGPDKPPGQIAEQDEFVDIGGVRIPRSK